MQSTTSNQTFGAFTISIVRNSAGQRAAKIVPAGFPAQYVPVEMLSLMAGKDTWMRNILVKCSACRTPAKACEMEADCCQTCFDKQGEENAKADGLVTA